MSRPSRYADKREDGDARRARPDIHPTGEHVRTEHVPGLRRSSIVLGAALAALLGTAASARGQALEDVRTPDTPLVLKAQGSFVVGGDTVEQTQGELGDL